MQIDVLSEIAGARGVWIQKNPGRSPSNISLSVAADQALSSALSSTRGGAPIGQPVVTCNGEHVYGMKILVEEKQKPLIRISQ